VGADVQAEAVTIEGNPDPAIRLVYNTIFANLG
jgi:hypothetical protein